MVEEESVPQVGGRRDPRLGLDFPKSGENARATCVSKIAIISDGILIYRRSFKLPDWVTTFNCNGHHNRISIYAGVALGLRFQ